MFCKKRADSRLCQMQEELKSGFFSVKFILVHCSAISLKKGSLISSSGISCFFQVALEQQFPAVLFQIVVKYTLPFSLIVSVQIALYPFEFQRCVETMNIDHLKSFFIIFINHFRPKFIFSLLLPQRNSYNNKLIFCSIP